MPVYAVPATENDAGATTPEDSDAAHDEVDPAEFRFHYRDNIVYVASNVEIPVYAARADDPDDPVRSLGAQEMHAFDAPDTSGDGNGGGNGDGNGDGNGE